MLRHFNLQMLSVMRTYSARLGCYGYCLRLRARNSQEDWSQHHSDIAQEYCTPEHR